MQGNARQIDRYELARLLDDRRNEQSEKSHDCNESSDNRKEESQSVGHLAALHENVANGAKIEGKNYRDEEEKKNSCCSSHHPQGEDGENYRRECRG
jgi:hypothetical protein